MTAAREYITGGMVEVDGWFGGLDAEIFTRILEAQHDGGFAGDLLEIGAYLGRSAILLGHFRREGEDLVVCDPFDAAIGDGEMLAENQRFYEGLTRDRFLANWHRFHGWRPVIVEDYSSVLPERMRGRIFRFVHVDGSHVYNAVLDDLLFTRDAAPEGVVVFDDVRMPHTPGVGAAVWGAIATVGLVPLAYGTDKLYATWDATGRVAQSVHGALEGMPLQESEVRGHRVVCVGPPAPERPGPIRRALRAVTPPAAASLAQRLSRPRRRSVGR